MLRDPRFARASYALFAVAVVTAAFKMVVMSGAKPVLMLDAPAKTAVAQARAPLEEDLPVRPLLDLPEPGDREEAPATLGARFEGREASAKDPSVFRRPSKSGSASEPVCGNLGDFPASSRAVFPLPRAFFGSYEPGWGSPRPQGGHEGTDLMSPSGTPEFAITDGTIVEVAGTSENGWNRLGGYTVMIRAAYDIGPVRKGDLFYYAHLDRESSLPIGSRVRAGQHVGYVGDTGQGKQGTRGEFPSHLHFGWYDADESGRRSKTESGAMDPYPLLLWLEKYGGAVSGGTDASYCEAPQGEIPAQNKPGERPDLDTGRDGDARPSPAAGKDDEPRRQRPEQSDEPTYAAAADSRPPETSPAQDRNDQEREPVPSDGEKGGTPGDGPQITNGEEHQPPPDVPNPAETGSCDPAEDRREPRERERELEACDLPADDGDAPSARRPERPEDRETQRHPASTRDTDQTGPGGDGDQA